MNASHTGELAAYLRQVRSRWSRVRMMRAWTASAIAAAAVVLLALLIQILLRPGAMVSAWLWSGSVLVTLACFVPLLRLLRDRPVDLQIARLVEERCPEIDDALVTAVSVVGNPATPLTDAVLLDAISRVRRLPLDRVVPMRTVGRVTLASIAATLLLVVSAGVAMAPAVRGVRLMAFFMAPGRFGLVVTPGNARVPAGQALEVRARLPVAAEGAVPVLRVDDGERRREVAMQPADGGFVLPIAQVDRDFTYTVSAAGVTSPVYSVTALHPPRVERIDLHYDYPVSFGMKPRDEPAGGDIYGPAGTRVRVSIQTDKAVSSGQLTLLGGMTLPLTAQGDRLEGELTIGSDSSYRIALSDADGLRNPGDVEYFIRTLDDRPPDVRIIHPAADRRATRLEEVSIEARADDDFGVGAFDLVYSVKGTAERVVSFSKPGAGLSVSGRQIIYLEDLAVEPGDFVTYYARATDVSRGKRSTEARSDMFFIEVAPFDEEFVVSDAQAGGGGAGGDQAITDMIEAQKQIVTATWTLDRRIRDTGGRSDVDIKALARRQSDLRRRTLGAAAQAQRAADVRRRRNGTRPAAGPVPLEESDDAVGRAADAMLRAERQLEVSKTSAAIPFEMTALNELMRADADVRRREIQRQQTAGAAGGENRQQQDLSALFDKELARQQETNVESQKGTSETGRGQGQSSAALDKVRDLARRQEALNREQDAGSGKSGTDTERRRQLERLTREQLSLKQQADDLAQQIGQSESSSPESARSGTSQAGGVEQRGRQALEQIAEDMQSAADDLRQQDRDDANARGERALARLRDLEQRLSGSSAQGRQRQLGDLQMEARQLADAQRQLTGQSVQDQRQLAERASRLEQSVQRLAEQAQGSPETGAPLRQASQELAAGRVSERMRAGVDRSAADSIAKALERASERLGAAAAGESELSSRLSDELAKVQDLRERLDALARELAQGSKPGSQDKGEASQKQEQKQTEPGTDPWKDARQLLSDLRSEKALGASPEEGRFNPGRSAPGTEAFKRDMARWDTLKVQLRVALEKAEASAAARLRGQRAKDRLNAGASQSVPESYRRLVERYYRALAGDARP